jgi:hypothetical protein
MGSFAGSLRASFEASTGRRIASQIYPAKPCRAGAPITLSRGRLRRAPHARFEATRARAGRRSCQRARRAPRSARRPGVGRLRSRASTRRRRVGNHASARQGRPNRAPTRTTGPRGLRADGRPPCRADADRCGITRPAPFHREIEAAVPDQRKRRRHAQDPADC